MEHVAIDLGGRESQICVRAQDGTIVEERRWKTGELGRYLKRRPASRVVLETCAEAFSVADEAQAQGHEVRVVPATLAPALGVGERGTKTDTRDARKLSEVSTRIDLPSVHVPSSEARERKRLCGARDSLVQARTQLINHVRGALRTERVRIRPGKTETFVKRVQDSCRSVPGHLTAVLTAIEQLSEHIAALDKQVAQTAENDATCQLLMTMPGVGPVTALRFVATVDERKRFESAHKLEAYLGLAPGEDSSSDRKRRTGITKAGPTAMRWTLVQAAWAARRAKGKHPMLLWAQAIELRRGKRVAAIALARKMAGILYAMWRDRLPYDAHRAAVIPAPALK
jgi:transposase